MITLATDIADEVDAILAQVPGMRSVERGTYTLHAAGYAFTVPRAVLLDAAGEPVRFGLQLRFARVLRRLALLAGLDTMRIVRGPGAFRRAGYRRYVYIPGGTMTRADWLAVLARATAAPDASRPPEQLAMLADRIADAT